MLNEENKNQNKFTIICMLFNLIFFHESICFYLFIKEYF